MRNFLGSVLVCLPPKGRPGFFEVGPGPPRPPSPKNTKTSSGAIRPEHRPPAPLRKNLHHGAWFSTKAGRNIVGKFRTRRTLGSAGPRSTANPPAAFTSGPFSSLARQLGNVPGVPSWWIFHQWLARVLVERAAAASAFFPPRKTLRRHQELNFVGFPVPAPPPPARTLREEFPLRVIPPLPSTQTT